MKTELLNAHIAAGETPAYARHLAASGILPVGAALDHDQVAVANASMFTESYFSQPLTAFAVGFRDPQNTEAALEFIAPRVPAPRRFEYAVASNAEQFLSETVDDERAIGSDFKEVRYTSTKVTAKTANRGLTMCIDLDEVASTVGWEEAAVRKLRLRLLRNEFRRAVALLSAAATNTAKTWDTTAGKDPDQDVLSDLVTAATASGIRPNRVMYGDTSWSKRALAHRAQSTASGFSSASLTEAELAGLLGVDGVMISRQRYQSSASAKTETVGNLVLMFNAMAGQDPEDSSNIKRFVTPTTGGDFRVYTQQIGPKRYHISVEHYSLIKITSTLGIRQFTVS